MVIVTNHVMVPKHSTVVHNCYKFEVSQWRENGGIECDNIHGQEKSESCHVCPIHCEGEWTPEWTECTETCGGGTQSKTYTVITPADYGGDACPNITGDIWTQPCNTQPCPIDCEGHWSPSWSECSKTCGGGEQTKTYIIDVHPQFQGNPCPEETTITQPCNEHTCPAEDCEGEWSPNWTPCSQSCGGGTQEKTYTILKNELYGGNPCPNITGDKWTQPCNTEPCPVDCSYSWSPWSECNEECGPNGVMQRTFSIHTYPVGTGAMSLAKHSRICPTNGMQSRQRMSGSIRYDTCGVFSTRACFRWTFWCSNWNKEMFRI